MRTLIALSYSTWSEKARWALDHHGVRYVEEEYKPMIGEPLLRLRARKPIGKITVPILLEDGAVYDDSLAIAKHADAIGDAERLFPDDLRDAIDDWNRRVDAAMAEGRARLLARMRIDAGAQVESLEGVVPGPLRAPLRGVALGAMAYLERKHRDVTPAPGTLRATLDELRAALARHDGTVLGRFTFADIAAAAMLQFVCPVEDRFIHLGPATRAAWTDGELAPSHGDLLAWRDDLYARRRRRA